MDLTLTWPSFQLLFGVVQLQNPEPALWMNETSKYKLNKHILDAIPSWTLVWSDYGRGKFHQMFVRQFENPATLPPHGKREDFATSVLHQFQRGINWWSSPQVKRNNNVYTSLSMSHISLSLSLQAILTNTHPLSNVICLNHSVCAMPLYPSNSLDVLFWWPTLLKHMVVSKAQLVYCPILGKFQVLRRTFRKQNVNSIRVFFWAKFGVGR